MKTIRPNNVSTSNPHPSARLGPFFRSIRFRITLWFVVILAIILGAFSLFIYFRQTQVLRAETSSRLIAQQSQLENYYRAVFHALNEKESEPSEMGVLANENLPLLQPSDVFALLDPQGQVIQQSLNFPAEALASLDQTWQQLPNPSEPFAYVLSQTNPAGGMSQKDYLFVTSAVDFGGGRQAMLILGSPLDPGGQLPRLALTLSLVYALTLLVAFGGGYWLANQAMRPVQVITRTAREIGEHDLNRRLLLGRADELGQLADTFDEMLNRLQAAFERQRQFTADASHELRTPLTIIQLESSSALERRRTAAEYEATLGVIQAENERMSRLVNELLTLARLDAGGAALPSEKLDLSEVALDVVERLDVLARKNRVKLLTGDLGEANVWADRTFLNHVLTNLIENALKYAQGEKAEVRLQTGSQQRAGKLWAWVQVADNGPGIPAEHLPHLFDRFYRIDAARSQNDDESGEATSGSGLGLAIVQTIVQAYGGEVEVRNQIESGAIFTVWLPGAA